MSYQYPTKREIEFAMEEGWTREEAERGFIIVDYDGTGLLIVEGLIDAHGIDTDLDDIEATIEAELKVTTQLQKRCVSSLVLEWQNICLANIIGER